MSVKKLAEIILDLPGQMFFGFSEPAAAAVPQSLAASKPMQRTPQVMSADNKPIKAPNKGEGLPAAPKLPPANFAAEFYADGQPAEAVDEVAAPERGFVTESKACELFMNVAARLRPGQVKKSRVVFKPFRSTLYSFKIGRNGAAIVKFHQAFRQAGETVLHQAMELMLARRKSEKRLIAREAYDAFVREMPKGDFNLPGARKARRVALAVPGRYRSLDDSFDRINATYFSGRLKKPDLCWSPVRARRVLGSYQERYDRLIISQVFDSPKVPEFVLDFLMFHELLHKFLGIGRREDGKRCMHGPEFRSLEKQFKQYAQAQAYLKKL